MGPANAPGRTTATGSARIGDDGPVILTEHPVVDAVLDRHAVALGNSAPVYRGHVLRGLSYQALLLGAPVPDSAALAWAVHDLGIYTAGTFDYLPPSVALVSELAAGVGVTDVARAEEMVREHHGLRRRTDPLVETFRRADLVDASRGTIRAGLSRAQVREVVAALPYAGFHRQVLGGLLGHAVRHPRRPLPMMKL